MEKLVSVAEMQAIERQADSSGLSYAQMMENAGAGLAQAITEEFGFLDEAGILGLIGPGNNGGDALVCLALLAAEGWKAAAYLARPRPAEDTLVERLRQAGGEIIAADAGFSQLDALLQEHAVLLDGLLGTGFRLPLKDELARLLEHVRQHLEQTDQPPYVVAVDCPSGLDCDSGAAAPETIPADLTITMAALKRGLLAIPGQELSGAVRVVSIGLPEHLPAWQAVQRGVADAGLVAASLPARPADAHKGTFGTALVAAGSLNYTGAALLAGKAAYRAGAGLVTLAVPAPLHLALAGQFPEATWVLLPHEQGVIAESAAAVLAPSLSRATALLVGPGFGLEVTSREFIHRLLEGSEPGRRGLGFVRRPENPGPAASEAPRPPLVLDADGLKLLAQIPGWAELLPPESILTPHPGEMSILTGLSKDEIQADRIGAAERFARQWQAIVVLKGAFSVVAAPDGRTAVIPVATAALARAGTGDVLAGLITGLRAQGVAAFPAAAAGAWLHAQAGLAAEEKLGGSASVLAGDVLEALPGVLAAFGG